MDYSKILSRSWRIVKKNKVLWVWGMVVAAFAGGNGGGNWSRSLGNTSKSTPKEDLYNNHQNFQEKAHDVLGAATEHIVNPIVSIFSHISPLFWIALILGFIIFLAFSIALSIFIRNWSAAALISQCDAAAKDKVPTLEDGSDIGKKKWLQLFLVSLIGWGSLMGIGLFYFLICLILLVIPIIQIIGILGMVAGVIGWIIGLIFLTVFIAIGRLIIVLEHHTLNEVLSLTYQTTKKYFWNALVVGIINVSIGCFGNLVLFGIIGILAAIVFFGFSANAGVGLVLFFVIGLPLIVFFLSLILVYGLLQAFTTCNWVLFYQEIKKQQLPTQ